MDRRANLFVQLPTTNSQHPTPNNQLPTANYGEVPDRNSWPPTWFAALVFVILSTNLTIPDEYSSSLSSRSYLLDSFSISLPLFVGRWLLGVGCWCPVLK